MDDEAKLTLHGLVQVFILVLVTEVYYIQRYIILHFINTALHQTE